MATKKQAPPRAPRPKKPSMKSGPMQEMPNKGSLGEAMGMIDKVKNDMQGNNGPMKKVNKFVKKKV
jgi:hypothetical protein